MHLSVRRGLSATQAPGDDRRLRAQGQSIEPSMRIAVVGPDGAGKTSVVGTLQAQIPGSRVIYGGKNRDHLLATTALGLRLWHAARMLHVPGLAQAARFAVFYPLEYLENLARARVGKGRVVIYDRHPVDRMIMAEEFRRVTMGPDPRGARAFRLLFSQYPLLWVLRAWYTWLYPRFDLLCFLLPEADLLVERGGGQYSSACRAEAKRQAYAEVARELSRQHPVLVIEVSRDMSLDAVAARVMLALRDGKESSGTDVQRQRRL